MNEHWVTEPNGYIEPKVGKSGFSSIPPVTVIQVFQDTVKRHGHRKALCVKPLVNGKPASEWKVWTYQQYWDDSLKFAKSCAYYKVDIFKVVNILGFNSPEWFISLTGSIMAGCIGAGIYMTNAADSCHYITNHSKAEIMVVEGNRQLKKYSDAKNKCKTLKAIVVYGEKPDAATAASCGIPVHFWDDFLALGTSSGVQDQEIDTRGASIKPGNCASLIYTSGTTGPPKAVMISNDNVTWTARNIIDHYMDLNHEDRVVSYLPLSHIAAQLIDLFCILQLGACTYFADPDALKGSLTNTMKEVKPTFFFGVPRVWEKIQEKMQQIGRKSEGVKKILADWAKKLGAEHCRMQQYGNGGGAPCCYSCANILLTKIKEALGLDQAKACFTAAAPIAPETLMYFASLDIPVYEVFGQSECTGPHTVSAANCWKIGTCGRPIKGSTTMIAPDTKELCYKGRHVFMGYMYMPDKTAETIDDHGFLHSGDVAEFDDDSDPEIPGVSGFMKITGRIKELLITAGGENVPPVLIENEMKAAMVAVSNCIALGDKRKFLTMLLSLKVEVDKDAKPTDQLAADSLFVAKQIGSSATTYSAAKADPLWTDYVNAGIKQGNSKTTSNAQIIQKWKWLPVDFSEKEGDLTPTLKLKRSVVVEKNHDLIESMYK